MVRWELFTNLMEFLVLIINYGTISGDFSDCDVKIADVQIGGIVGAKETMGS